MRFLATVGTLCVLAQSSLALFELVDSSDLTKRQGNGFVPHTRPSDCDPAEGYVMCGSDLCYRPAIGQVCCDPSQEWGCPSKSFCLVDPYCCPDGYDPETCAKNFGVTLPPNYQTSPAVPPPTSATVVPYPPANYTSYTSYAPSGYPTGYPTTSYAGPVPTGAAPRFEGAAAAVAGLAGMAAWAIGL